MNNFISWLLVFDSYKKSFFTLIIISFLVTSCASWFEVMDANTAYNSKQYAVASELLIEEYNAQKDNLEKAKTAEKIGDCYRFSNQPLQAKNWYEKALEYSLTPETNYKYGLMLKADEQYEKAIQVFKEYAFSNPIERAKAKKQMRSCQLALEWLAEKNNYKLENLADINTSASDYSPVFYNKDQLVFTSGRNEAKGEDIYGWTGEKHTDLFISSPNGSENFNSPVSFNDSINTIFNEGTAAFAPDYSAIYYTQCGSKNETDDFCKIYYAQRNAVGNWSPPERLFLFDEDSINVGQPFLTNDGTRLYFAADAPDTYGDKDLYFVEKQAGGVWSFPKNLGPEINTTEYEGFPYVDKNGVFYFASSGHTGMGGLDIFSTKRKGKRWEKVENLKAPINSAADDFGIIWVDNIPLKLKEEVEKIGYFSSSRKSGVGNDDIYKISLEIPKESEIVEVDTTINEEPLPPAISIILEGLVLQKKYEIEDEPSSREIGTSPISDAVVEVLGLNFESTISERLITDENGGFTLPLEPNSEYRILASASGFFNQSKTIKTGDKSEIKKVQIVLDKIYQQKEITIPNIYYDLDKANIREDARPVLDELVILLKDNPSIVVEFGAHTDSRGQNRYNLDLSQRRAQSVVDYLTTKNIDGRRLKARGYGETQLTNECADGVTCTEEQHQENRRTTFKVISDRFRAN